MAKKFLVAIDLQQNELQNVVSQNLATAPSGAKNGQFYYNTNTKKFCMYENGAFVSFATTAEFTTELAKKVDLTVYEGKVADLTAAIAANAEAIALKANAADVYTKTEIDSKEDALEAAIALKADQSALNTLAGRVEVNEGDISGLKTRMTTAEGDIDALETLTASHTTSISGLTTRMGTAEADIDALETTVTGHTASIAANAAAIEAEETRATGVEEGLDERIEALETAELPIATTSSLGVVQIGSGLTITAAGLLTAIGAVQSVNGRTGAVVLDKTDVNLSNVDNTADLDKPISTATQDALDEKADAATTLAGYGITDAYTKTEVDAKVASVFRYKGSVNTYADLPTSGQVVGDVYNVKTADATHGIHAGDNVAWDGSAWDVLAGTIDLTPYLTKAEAETTYLGIHATADKATADASGNVITTTYATKDELGQVAQGSVHKITATNPALTPASGVATWTVSNSLNNADVDVTIVEVATNSIVVADVTVAAASVTIKMNADANITAGTYKAIIMG